MFMIQDMHPEVHRSISHVTHQDGASETCPPFQNLQAGSLLGQLMLTLSLSLQSACEASHLLDISH